MVNHNLFIWELRHQFQLSAHSSNDPLQCPNTGVHDQQHMLALVHTDPQANFHIIDLPYRFSSWAFDNPNNVELSNLGGESLIWRSR